MKRSNMLSSYGGNGSAVKFSLQKMLYNINVVEASVHINFKQCMLKTHLELVDIKSLIQTINFKLIIVFGFLLFWQSNNVQ